NRGPSYHRSVPMLSRLGSNFQPASGTSRDVVPSFAGTYTRPVAGWNAIGYQLCAPSFSGETRTGSMPAYAVGDSSGRSVLGSIPVAQVTLLTNGFAEMNWPVF